MTRRRSFGALASALVVAATLVATAPVPASAAITTPTYLRHIGFPGHAGVYAWGMATVIDGTIVTSATTTTTSSSGTRRREAS